MAVTTPVSAITDPTDRSMPPLTMIIVMPMAPSATITVCATTMRKLRTERYWSGVSVSSAKIATTATNPMKGPSVASQARDPVDEVVSAMWISHRDTEDTEGVAR